MADLDRQPRVDLTRSSPAAQALAMVVVAGVALAALVLVGVVSGAGRDVDVRLMQAWAYDDLVIGPLGAVVSKSFVAVGIAVLVIVALARRRPRLAVAVPVLVGGATVTTHVMKNEVLARVAPGSTMPSGHLTVVLSLLLAALVVAPVEWRNWLAGAAGFLGALCGIGVVIGTWHVPADVAAAAAVCLGWAGITLPLLGRGTTAERPPRSRAIEGPQALAMVGALSAFVLLAAYRLRLDVDGWLLASRLAGALLAAWIGLVVGWLAAVLDRMAV